LFVFFTNKQQPTTNNQVGGGVPEAADGELLDFVPLR
jgi:hypothetical protein